MASAFILVGNRLVRFGRSGAAFRAALIFTLWFALSVQYFLFRWPGWMFSYLLPEDAFPLAVVSPAFFLAVVGAGTAGAFITLHLVRRERFGWAVANALFGLGAWILLWIATWDPYFHVGTFESYHAGLAPRSEEVPAFQAVTAIAGASYGVLGLSLAFWMVAAGRRARRATFVQPDPAPPWRERLEPPPAGADPSIRERIARARAAQVRWAGLPVGERIEALRRVRAGLLEQGEALAALLEEEIGRPRAESYLSEIIPGADLFDWWLGEGALHLQPRSVPIDPLLFPGKRGVVEPLPRGVVAAIAPWNFPVMLPLRTLVPSLLAGNAVVLKPSEFAPRSGAFLGELFSRALGPDLVQVIQGGGEAGRAVIEAGVDLVVFIGSRRTGQAVARAAAQSLTPVVLELGSKDAAIVLEDADLERSAAGIVWAAFANAGQNCASIERCYVVEAVRDDFVARLRAEIEKLRVGPGGEGQVDVGPLATPPQKEIVEAQLEEARQRGVPIFSSARTASGRFLNPSLVVDPPPDLALCREETFGPVLPVFTVPDAEAAVRAANDSPFGLTVSVWSKDLHRAELLGRRIDAGVVTINNHAFTGGLAQAPWGGVRGSGYGVTNSAQMLEQLTRPRFVLVDRGLSRSELWWYPYDKALLRLARGLVRLRSPGAARLAGLREVAAGFLARRRSRASAAPAAATAERAPQA